MFNVSGNFEQSARSDYSPSIASVLITIATITLVGVLLSPEPIVVLASGVALIVICASLWQHPILLVFAGLQFSEVALKPIATAFTVTPLNDWAEFDVNLQPAALFGLAGVVAIVLGQRVGAGQPLQWRARLTAENLPFESIIVFTLGAIVVGHGIDFFISSSGSAAQIMASLSSIKYMGIFVLAYVTLRMRKRRRLCMAVVAVELLLGMTGFFSEFRLVLLVVAAAAIAAITKVQIREIAALAIGAIFALTLGVFWSAVKEEYRYFLNDGTGEQVVIQPFDKRVAYIVNELAEFDSRKFSYGAERLFNRLSYIDFLAATLHNVPAVIPYENGGQLGGAILHVMTPRILFPDKPPVPSDTEVTAYYTGLPIDAREVASISIGYLGELYIDFGFVGALVAAFLLGFAFGRTYRSILNYPKSPYYVNLGLCMMIALGWTSFGTALIKIVGGLVMVCAVALVLQRWLLPSYFGQAKLYKREA